MMKKWILHMLMLGLCSVEDYREKKISMWKFILLLTSHTLSYSNGRDFLFLV